MAVDLKALRAKALALHGDQEGTRQFWLAVRHLAKTDLLAYGLWVHGEDFKLAARAVEAAHIRQAVRVMEDHPKTLFIWPPEHFKSTLLQWDMERWIGVETERHFNEKDYPAPSAAYIMNAANQSEKMCMLLASTLESNPRYRQLFPHVEPAPKLGWTKSELFLQRRVQRKDPTLTACGMFGPVQGFRFGKIALDDPVDQQDAKSDKVMDQQIAWVLGMLDDRLMDGGESRGALTLWGKKGVGNTLLQIPDWYSVVFPCYGQSPRYGTKQWEGENYPWGRVLWPEEWPEERLEGKRRSKQLVEGGDLWSLAYLCNPAPSQGNMFNRAWLQYEPSPVAEILAA